MTHTNNNYYTYADFPNKKNKKRNLAKQNDLLVDVVVARLTHTHLPLNTKLWDGGRLAGAIPTEHLATGTTVVLQHVRWTATVLSSLYKNMQSYQSLYTYLSTCI